MLGRRYHRALEPRAGRAKQAPHVGSKLSSATVAEDLPSCAPGDVVKAFLVITRSACPQVDIDNLADALLSLYVDVSEACSLDTAVAPRIAHAVNMVVEIDPPEAIRAQ